MLIGNEKGDGGCKHFFLLINVYFLTRDYGFKWLDVTVGVLITGGVFRLRFFWGEFVFREISVVSLPTDVSGDIVGFCGNPKK